MKHFFATSFMAVLFACLSFTVQAQTATVTVTNSTACALEVAVLGAASSRLRRHQAASGGPALAWRPQRDPTTVQMDTTAAVPGRV